MTAISRACAALCLSAAVGLPSLAGAQTCVNFDHIPLGTTFGAPGTVLPPSHRGIRIVTETFCHGGGCGNYNSIEIMPDQGLGQTKQMAFFNNANVWVLTREPFREAVAYTMDKGGNENVGVTGTGMMMTEFMASPVIPTPLADIVVSVGGSGGEAKVLWTETAGFPLNALLVGGQELFVAEICFD